MLHRQWYVECPEHRGGPYTRSRAYELRDKWNDLNIIRADADPDGEILATGCNPHRVIFRIGRKRPNEVR